MRFTPGLVMFIGLLGLAGWFTLQPQEQRVMLACKPIVALHKWIESDEIVTDPSAPLTNNAFDSFVRLCPRTLGKQAAAMADDVQAFAGRAVDEGKALHDKAGTLTNRRIEAIIDGERLHIEGLGEARLLGIRVPPESHAAAISYLRRIALGTRLRLDLDRDLDPERRPLVSLTLPNGLLLNAAMIQQRLATPWRIPGPWQHWAQP